MKNMKTKFEIYLDKEMQDPEFKAQYIISRQKAELEFILEEFRENIATEFSISSVNKGLKKIDDFIHQDNTYNSIHTIQNV
jgi:hypothetical protein